MAKQDTRHLFRQESLERLSSPERLDELMRLVDLRAWLPLATIGALLGLGLLWSLLGRIPVTVKGQGLLVRSEQSTAELVALLRFDNRYRGQFRAGMPVVLMPETLLVYNQPGIEAEVTEVLEPPALTLEQARQGKAPEAEAAAATSGRLEVVAELAPMVQAIPPDTLVRGVAVEGRVTLEERAPITFVFPFLAQ